jgi:hypothetical protein
MIKRSLDPRVRKPLRTSGCGEYPGKAAGSLSRIRAGSTGFGVLRLLIKHGGLTPLLNLYRIMTDVRAGSHQPSVAAGEPGIVTLWVRAESERTALARANIILTSKRYASIGRLSSYAEAVANDPLAYAIEEEQGPDRHEDSVLAGYDAMKEHALAQADGLHELWLGTPVDKMVRQKKIA